MSRSIAASVRRSLIITAAAALLASGPAQAATTWTRVLPTDNEAQGLAAAPGGGAYVAVSPTLASGKATLFSYSKTGGKTWSVELGAGGLNVLGIVSDAAGNAYVGLASALSDSEGYPYRIQQVKRNGELGWSQTWHDADASLTGDAVAIKGAQILIAQRDTASGATTIRRFATADGAPASTWTVSAANGPAARPIDLAVTAAGAYLLDASGKVVALRPNGTWRWSRQLPGGGSGGLGLDADATGISAVFDADFMDLRVRRFALDGTARWTKELLGGTSHSTITTVGGTTWVTDSVYTNDAVQSQVVIFRFDATGRLKAKVKAGTANRDSANALLVSGDYLYVAGYVWTADNKPLLMRIKKP